MITTRDILLAGQARIEQNIKNKLRFQGRYGERIQQIREYLQWCDATNNPPLHMEDIQEALERAKQALSKQLGDSY